MKMLSAKKIIKNHSDQYKIFHKNEGYFDGPNWVEGQNDEYYINAAVFSFTNEEVQKYEGLSYTTKDIKVLIIKPLQAHNIETGQDEEISINKKDKIEFKDKTYEFDENDDNTIHSDYIRWFAKRVENQ